MAGSGVGLALAPIARSATKSSTEQVSRADRELAVWLAHQDVDRVRSPTVREGESVPQRASLTVGLLTRLKP